MNLELVFLAVCFIVFTRSQRSAPSSEQRLRLYPRTLTPAVSWLTLTDPLNEAHGRTSQELSQEKTPFNIPTGLTDLKGVSGSRGPTSRQEMPTLPRESQTHSGLPSASSRDSGISTDASSPRSRASSSRPAWYLTEAPPVAGSAAGSAAGRTPILTLETSTNPEGLRVARGRAERLATQQRHIQSSRKFENKRKADPVLRAKRKAYQKIYWENIKKDPVKYEERKAQMRAWNRERSKNAVRGNKREHTQQDNRQEIQQRNSSPKKQKGPVNVEDQSKLGGRRKPELPAHREKAARWKEDLANTYQRRVKELQAEGKKEKAKNKTRSTLLAEETRKTKSHESQSAESQSLPAWAGRSARKERTPATNAWKKDMLNLIKPAGQTTLGSQQHGSIDRQVGMVNAVPAAPNTSKAKEASQSGKFDGQLAQEVRRRPRKATNPHAQYR